MNTWNEALPHHAAMKQWVAFSAFQFEVFINAMSSFYKACMVTHQLMGSPCSNFAASLCSISKFVMFLSKQSLAQLALSQVITMASGYSSTAVHHDHVWRSTYETPLQCAAMEWHTDIVKFLPILYLWTVTQTFQEATTAELLCWWYGHVHIASQTVASSPGPSSNSPLGGEGAWGWG